MPVLGGINIEDRGPEPVDEVSALNGRGNLNG